MLSHLVLTPGILLQRTTLANRPSLTLYGGGGGGGRGGREGGRNGGKDGGRDGGREGVNDTEQTWLVVYIPQLHVERMLIHIIQFSTEHT